MKKIRHRVMMDNVLLAIDSGEIRSEGGIVIETANSRAAQGIARDEGVIESIGKEAFGDYSDEERPKVGDRVLIPRYSGTTAGKYEDDKERRIVQDTSILAIIEEVQ